jgi:hypothetical protein
MVSQNVEELPPPQWQMPDINKARFHLIDSMNYVGKKKRYFQDRNIE